MKAISYARFSSPKQAHGHSLERQTEATDAWCKAKGVVLDDSLRLKDLGVSAWSGKNAKSGALSGLLELAKQGKIERGTYLIIEALDRLTRLELIDALPILFALVKAGLTVVTLNDKKEYTRKSLGDLSEMLSSVLILARGHDESERKSGMVRDAFEAARVSHSREEFGAAPGWLTRVDKKSPWTIIETKADAVRKVFELAAGGFGSPAIAKLANAEKWLVPTRVTKHTTAHWHTRMPGHLLRNRAVLGEHEYRERSHEANDEHWHGRATGIVVSDYYPRIIDDDLWYRAQAEVDSRVAPKRRDENYFNIWSGLMFCGECGATIQRKIEYRGVSRGQLVCSNRMCGLKECKTASVGRTDPSLLREVTVYAATRLGLDSKKQDASAQLVVEKAKLKVIDDGSTRIADAIAATGGAGALPVLMQKLVALGADRKACIAAIDKCKQQIATAKYSLFDDSYAVDVIARLYEKSDEAKALRAECNTRLKRAVKRVWVWAYDCALVQYIDDIVLQVVYLPKKTAAGEQPNFALAQKGMLIPPLSPEQWQEEAAALAERQKLEDAAKSAAKAEAKSKAKAKADKKKSQPSVKG